MEWNCRSTIRRSHYFGTRLREDLRRELQAQKSSIFPEFPIPLSAINTIDNQTFPVEADSLAFLQEHDPVARVREQLAIEEKKVENMKTEIASVPCLSHI